MLTLLSRIALAGVLCAFFTVDAIVYVSPTGDNTLGVTWETALNNLEDALAQAAPDEFIYVGEGIYNVPNVLVVPDKNLEIYGGFPATSTGVSDVRDPELYPTVLTGGGVTGSIFLISNVTVVIDGFSLKNCVGEGSGYAKGGAIRVESAADAEIRFCSFIRNKIDGYGGGINIIDAAAEVKDCVFKNNSAEEGGGIKVHQGSLSVARSLFQNNSASVIGGAASGYESDVSFDTCLFIRNEGPYGGAVEAHEGAGAEFKNCLFAKNIGATQGGALSFTYQDDVSISHSTFVRNKTDGNGGGVFMHDSTGEISNTIFAFNKDIAIFENDENADPDVKNCLFHLNTDGAYFNEGLLIIPTGALMNASLLEAADNLDGDPLFADLDAGDYHIRLGSPAIDTGTADGASDFDIDGSARPMDVPNVGADATGTEYDIGYDEYDPNAALIIVEPSGGETVLTGVNPEFLIEWNSVGYTGLKVKLELWRRGEFVQKITTTKNDGNYLWTVPTDVRAGGKYKVRILSTSFPEFEDFSRKFSIIN